MSIISQQIFKSFGDAKILNGIDIEVKSGEIVALLGPSGSGKTIFLRIISGLEFPDSGNIIINGENVSNKHVRERQIGFVFQHYALFRHMNVFENIAFGLRIKSKKLRPTEDEITQKVENLLELVHLKNFARHFPSQLSGGQRQRVALARSLAVEPKLLLLDEPFGALDVKVRRDLRRWIRNLHDQVGLTSIFVTHDQEEAMEIADRIIIMRNGNIEQVGTPQEVYQSPATAFVFDFVGNSSSVDGFVDADGALYIYGKEFGHKSLGINPDLGRNTEVKIYFRPHDVEVTNSEDYDIKGQIKMVNVAGPHAKIEVLVQDGIVNLEIPNWEALEMKGEIYFKIRNFKVY